MNGINNLPDCVELITDPESINNVNNVSQYIHTVFLSDFVINAIKKVIRYERNGYIISFNHFSLGSLCVVDDNGNIYNIPLQLEFVQK